MTPADVVAVGAFFAIVVAGLIGSSLRDLARQHPQRRIETRMGDLSDERAPARREAEPDKPNELFSREKVSGEYGALRLWVQRHLERLRTVSGAGGIRLIVVLALASLVAAVVAVKLAALPLWALPLLYIGVPALVVRLVYRMLINQFRTRFLTTFPDTLDLIIRAVRAGIPVVQAISTAGAEAEEPVRSTFRTMGDGLRLGADLKEVLDQATERLQIADFSFFAVCLQLQRETGGNLAETLENLAGIIRTRRDIRLKTRALTAEGRIASKIISAVPFVITAFLYLVNRPYIDLLFRTRAGHKMLILAAVLLTVGLALIHKISKLDTSR